jgi:hypothetical protein
MKFKIKQDELCTHADFIRSIDGFCMSKLANDQHKLNYMFFIADVVAYSKIDGLQPQYYYNIAKELIIVNKRFLEYHKRLQDMLQKRNTKMIEKVNKYRKNKYELEEANINENYYVHKAEENILNLLRNSEPLDQ